MTSEPLPEEAYVWIWLPSATEPVVCGRLAREGNRVIFNYGQSYLARRDAVALYEPELPLRRGAIIPAPGLTMAGCVRDAAPDAWGRRVILHRIHGTLNKDADTAALHELTYLLESGSDRLGAIDFQRSATEHVPRATSAATLEELSMATESIERGTPLRPDLAAALLHGTSIGGARPKGLLQDGERKLIAKFSSSTDTYNVVKAEYMAMRLAARAGLEVAPVRLARAAGKDVLLVERFDRERTSGGWRRRAVVSALTLFELDEMMARYASYQDLAEIVRHRFTSPKATLRELFGRLVFNVLCGNTDDHARNHAAFWDGRSLTLTPAYDICPQSRTGNEASQAMLITGDQRTSTLATCLRASAQFQLTEEEAAEIIRGQISAIRDGWRAVCEEACLSQVEQRLFGERFFLNPFIFQGAPAHVT